MCLCVFVFLLQDKAKAGELSHRLRMATGGCEDNNANGDDGATGGGDSTDEDSVDGNENQRQRRYRKAAEEEGEVAAAVLQDRHVRSMAALAEMEVGDAACTMI
eukprot:COSAG06_NODE_25028_length_647_cov_0.916058_2_plen_104_part_00